MGNKGPNRIHSKHKTLIQHKNLPSNNFYLKPLNISSPQQLLNPQGQHNIRPHVINSYNKFLPIHNKKQNIFLPKHY